MATQRSEAEQDACTPRRAPDTQWQQHCPPLPSSATLCQPSVLVAVLKLITIEIKAAVVPRSQLGGLYSHSPCFSFRLFCLGVETGSFSQGHSQTLAGDPAEFSCPLPQLFTGEAPLCTIGGLDQAVPTSASTWTCLLDHQDLASGEKRSKWLTA